jgi:hypothetical protein
MIAMLNSLYLTAGLRNYVPWCPSTVAGIVCLGLHASFYYYSGHARDRGAARLIATKKGEE